MKYVVYQVGDTFYGTAILQISSIEKLTNLQSVPAVNPEVKGIVVLRGEVVPVIDLHYLLSGEHGDGEKIIVVEIETDNKVQKAAFIVDDVKEIPDVDKLKPLPVNSSPLAEGLFESTDGITVVALDLRKYLISHKTQLGEMNDVRE